MADLHDSLALDNLAFGLPEGAAIRCGGQSAEPGNKLRDFQTAAPDRPPYVRLDPGLSIPPVPPYLPPEARIGIGSFHAYPLGASLPIQDNARCTCPIPVWNNRIPAHLPPKQPSLEMPAGDCLPGTCRGRTGIYHNHLIHCDGCPTHRQGPGEAFCLPDIAPGGGTYPCRTEHQPAHPRQLW